MFYKFINNKKQKNIIFVVLKRKIIPLIIAYKPDSLKIKNVNRIVCEWMT